MKAILTLLIALLIFTSCNDYGKPQQTTFHGDFQLELIFEKDSCKMYRFFDAGHAVYWSTCAGRVQEDHWHQTSKNSGHRDYMQSITNR